MMRLLLTVLVAATIGVSAQQAPRVIDIWPEGVPNLRPDASAEKMEGVYVSNVHQPTLTMYPAPADRATGSAVVICPGGGYMRLAMEHEGTMVAEWLNSLGVCAFILKYRMQEYGYPAPLQDVLRALRTVRSRGAQFGVRPDRIGVLGSSAGGHLASSAATLYDDPDGRTGAALDAVSARPDFAILLYPVVSMKEPFAHAGSRRALLGDNPAPALLDKMSTDLRVTSNTPPTFMVHAENDTAVPLENTLAFYQALRKAGVEAELHVYEKGGHGFGMRGGLGPTSEWPKRCEEWMRSHGWLAK